MKHLKQFEEWSPKFNRTLQGAYQQAEVTNKGFGKSAKSVLDYANRSISQEVFTIETTIIKEGIDYNETIDEFYKMQDMLVDLAEKGKFVLHVTDRRNGTKETYGVDDPSSRTKREVYARINQPTIMVIVPRGNDKYFGRDFTELLTKEFRVKFPKMHFSGDYGYSIEVRPKKFVEQGFYGEF